MSNIYASDPEGLEQGRPSFCLRFLKYTWKTISCLFSHITLVSMVVAYCVLGAYTFQKLEKENEKTVKRNISNIRNHAIDQIWNITSNDEDEVLYEEFFIGNTTGILREFEKNLWIAITKHGWDGDEDTDKVQWDLPGALFYSIIVITTIGYGHIAPRTPWGKVVTIFYAILGIPLMLLCLSNIGDIMATSFRFLYWKVCCYVCTKQPKRPKRARSTRSTIRSSSTRTMRSRTTSFKRSTRTSTRSADSGYEVSDIGPTSHSDTELRYHDDMPKLRTPSQPRSSQRSRFSDATSIPVSRLSSKQNFRGGSLDRRKMAKNLNPVLDPMALAKTPVLCNKYVVAQTEMAIINHVTPNRFERNSDRSPREPPSPPIQNRRAVSMPRTNYLEPPREPSPTYTYKDEVESIRSSRRKKKHYNPSPTIMSPLGYMHRSKYLDDPESDEDYYDDYYEPNRSNIKPVPIWLCVLLVVSYIVAGTFLFTTWEKWPYLDSAYFCFITLTTIGFGDLFPAGRVKDAGSYQQNIAFCSLYLLFGIALLAMSFNLVQEEVIANVKRVAKSLGIIKKEEVDDDDDD